MRSVQHARTGGEWSLWVIPLDENLVRRCENLRGATLQERKGSKGKGTLFCSEGEEVNRERVHQPTGLGLFFFESEFVLRAATQHRGGHVCKGVL
jgi:hypothetical protein